MKAENRKYVTDRQIAERYGVSRATVWRWAKQGRLPQPVMLSTGCTRWPSDALDAHDLAAESHRALPQDIFEDDAAESNGGENGTSHRPRGHNLRSERRAQKQIPDAYERALVSLTIMNAAILTAGNDLPRGLGADAGNLGRAMTQHQADKLRPTVEALIDWLDEFECSMPRDGQ